MFNLASASDSFKVFGKIKTIFLFKSLTFGTFSLVVLSKFVCEARNSVWALIKLAFAPAREDSDWAKSVKVISPFWSLALSDSTCLSNKLIFDKLNISFSDLKTLRHFFHCQRIF